MSAELPKGEPIHRSDSSASDGGRRESLTRSEILSHTDDIKELSKKQQLLQSKTCANCGKETTRLCPRCLSVYFCSKECMDKMNSVHRKSCCQARVPLWFKNLCIVTNNGIPLDIMCDWCHGKPPKIECNECHVALYCSDNCMKSAAKSVQHDVDQCKEAALELVNSVRDSFGDISATMILGSGFNRFFAMQSKVGESVVGSELRDSKKRVAPDGESGFSGNPPKKSRVVPGLLKFSEMFIQQRRDGATTAVAIPVVDLPYKSTGTIAVKPKPQADVATPSKARMTQHMAAIYSIMAKSSEAATKVSPAHGKSQTSPPPSATHQQQDSSGAMDITSSEFSKSESGKHPEPTSKDKRGKKKGGAHETPKKKKSRDYDSDDSKKKKHHHHHHSHHRKKSDSSSESDKDDRKKKAKKEKDKKKKGDDEKGVEKKVHAEKKSKPKKEDMFKIEDDKECVKNADKTSESMTESATAYKDAWWVGPRIQKALAWYTPISALSKNHPYAARMLSSGSKSDLVLSTPAIRSGLSLLYSLLYADPTNFSMYYEEVSETFRISANERHPKRLTKAKGASVKRATQLVSTPIDSDSDGETLISGDASSDTATIPGISDTSAYDIPFTVAYDSVHNRIHPRYIVVCEMPITRKKQQPKKVQEQQSAVKADEIIHDTTVPVVVSTDTKEKGPKTATADIGVTPALSQSVATAEKPSVHAESPKDIQPPQGSSTDSTSVVHKSVYKIFATRNVREAVNPSMVGRTEKENDGLVYFFKSQNVKSQQDRSVESDFVGFEPSILDVVAVGNVATGELRYVGANVGLEKKVSDVYEIASGKVVLAMIQTAVENFGTYDGVPTFSKILYAAIKAGTCAQCMRSLKGKSVATKKGYHAYCRPYVWWWLKFCKGPNYNQTYTKSDMFGEWENEDLLLEPTEAEKSGFIDVYDSVDDFVVKDEPDSEAEKAVESIITKKRLQIAEESKRLTGTTHRDLENKIVSDALTLRLNDEKVKAKALEIESTCTTKDEIMRKLQTSMDIWEIKALQLAIDEFKDKKQQHSDNIKAKAKEIIEMTMGYRAEIVKELEAARKNNEVILGELRRLTDTSDVRIRHRKEELGRNAEDMSADIQAYTKALEILDNNEKRDACIARNGLEQDGRTITKQDNPDEYVNALMDDQVELHIATIIDDKDVLEGIKSAVYEIVTGTIRACYETRAIVEAYNSVIKRIDTITLRYDSEDDAVKLWNTIDHDEKLVKSAHDTISSIFHKCQSAVEGIQRVNTWVMSEVRNKVAKLKEYIRYMFEMPVKNVESGDEISYALVTDYSGDGAEYKISRDRMILKYFYSNMKVQPAKLALDKAVAEYHEIIEKARKTVDASKEIAGKEESKLRGASQEIVDREEERAKVYVNMAIKRVLNARDKLNAIEKYCVSPEKYTKIDDSITLQNAMTAITGEIIDIFKDGVQIKVASDPEHKGKETDDFAVEDLSDSGVDDEEDSKESDDTSDGAAGKTSSDDMEIDDDKTAAAASALSPPKHKGVDDGVMDIDEAADSSDKESEDESYSPSSSGDDVSESTSGKSSHDSDSDSSIAEEDSDKDE